MKMVLFAVLLSATALITCSDTSAKTGMSAAICYSNECRLPERTACQTIAHKVSVKDIPPIGCAIPLGQVAEMIEAKTQSVQK
jgi:hypothetical protein